MPLQDSLIAATALQHDLTVVTRNTADYRYAGVEIIEGIRLIKHALPRAKTILGISNVSFGLPAAGREVLNSVLLHHCVQAGLDLAMVNTEGLPRYQSIPEEERTAKTAVRKGTELVYALKLTREYPKEQILDWYLKVGPKAP